VVLSGCADIKTPDPGQIIKNPIGPNLAKVGMTKSHVTSLYGEPNFKKIDVVSEKWEGIREEWFYRATMTGLPMNADYLAEDLYLYFDGNNLTNISHVPLEKMNKDRKYADQANIK